MTVPAARTALPPRSRFPRWAKVVCALLALVLVPTGAALAWLVLAFSGGIDELLSGRVDADDERVVQAREAAAAALDDDVASLPVGGPVLARTTGDDCQAGQHNWKIDDDFDLHCTAGRAVVVAAGADRAVDEPALLADGWAVDSTTAPVSYVRDGSRLLVQEVVPATYLSIGYPLYDSPWESVDGRTVASEDVAAVVPQGTPGTVLVVSTEYFRE